MTLYKGKILIAACACAIFFMAVASYAQNIELEKIKRLEARIISNPQAKETQPLLEELSGYYIKANGYENLAAFLKKLDKAVVNRDCGLPLSYYLSLCRYHQLRYLEETQNWKEYFDSAAAYRDELFKESKKAAHECPLSSFAVKAQILNWLEHKSRNDSEARASLKNVVSLINMYVKESTGDIQVIKDAADILAKEKETALAKAAYNLYVNRLISTEVSVEKLKANAQEAYSSGNLELAEVIYDRYISLAGSFLPKDKLAGELIAVALQFAVSPARGILSPEINDGQYAEKIFTLIEELCPRGCINEETLYLRAYNLQKNKEYQGCAREYSRLIQRFPQGRYVNEAEFKIGVIYAYVLDKKADALDAWQKIITRGSSLGYVLESIYHKSLISQYEGGLEDARGGYEKIISLAEDARQYKNVLERVNLRLKEIEGSRSLEYSLLSFLDGSLKEAVINKRPLEVSASPLSLDILSELKISVPQVEMRTGCFSPELNYLWSGDLGNVSPLPVDASFNTAYDSPGTKVFNLAVVNSNGLIGASVEMVEVYEKN